ncbi:copper resistance protein NlpE [Acinetobacter nosocomialis]|uniref:copper resistance protein NlpE n=1 Tax=Acinetobacter nosocomialis TaxID=106654 RepID=UPI00125060EC|nr:copper resistance protein NlpE [Acinetobacter nosocomialis]
MKKSLLAIALMSTLLVACNKHENKTETTSDASTPVQTTEASNAVAVDTEHTAENSLDWNGKYKGTLPCADCEGIKTELKLKADKTYELPETYLRKGDTNTFNTHGKFAFDKDNTSVITLDDKAQNRKFFIGENTATALDMEGKKVEGSLAEHYVLKKED